MNLREALRVRREHSDIEAVCAREGVAREAVVDGILAGRIAVLHNAAHALAADGVRAVGQGLSTKVNANLGTSSDATDIESELRKLQVAVDAGADTVMDLSTGGAVADIRRRIVDA